MRLEYQFSRDDIKRLCKLQDLTWTIPVTYLSWVGFAVVGLLICFATIALPGVITFAVVASLMLGVFSWFFSQNIATTIDQAGTSSRSAELKDTFIEFWANGIGCRIAWWWVTNFETKDGFWILKHDETFVGVIPTHAVSAEQVEAVESFMRHKVDQAKRGDDMIEFSSVAWSDERFRCSFDMSREEVAKIRAETFVSGQHTSKPVKSNPLTTLAIVAVLTLLIFSSMMAKQFQIETEGIGLGILIFLGILISWFFSMKQLLRIVNARRMAKRSDDEFEQSTTFIWTGDGIVLATPTGGVLLPWRGIYKATETKLTVRLERRDFYYSFIPKRIFEENEIQMFDFIESVNECVANVVESPNLEGEYTERGNPYDSSGGLN